MHGDAGTRRYEHDAAGLIHRVVASTGAVEVTNYYDPAGRITEQDTEYGRRVRYRYLPNGITDVSNEDASYTNLWVSDQYARLTAIVDAEGGRASYAYDDFVFQSGLVDIDSQTGTAGGAFVEFDLYVKKTTPAEEPTTEEPTEETVNINYVPVGPAGASFGSVDSASETVMEKSGTALGSTPTANPGFKFVGWYKNEACTEAVNAGWVTGNMLKPDKTKNYGTAESPVMGYETATYYAKFDYAVADLTIKQDGGIADENQTFIYVVTGGDLPASGIKVAVKGNSSVTIKNLKIGSYTVTEGTNWNWRCGTTGGSQSITLQGAQTNEVRFTNTVSNSKWLSGNAYSVL